MSTNRQEKSLALADLRASLLDLFHPSARIYWTDFLLSVSLGWVGFIAVEILPAWSVVQILAFFVSTFALFRAVLFIHELTHLRRGAIPYFTIVWNALCGIPLLYPSFLYMGVHADHHKKFVYGTEEDAEYLPFGASSPWRTFLYFAQIIYLPFPVVIRFALLTPISLIHPRIRRLIEEYASAMAINFEAKRAVPTGEDLRDWRIQEFFCFLWVWFVIGLFATGVLGFSTFLHWYLMSILLLGVNSLRTVVAHRYANPNTKQAMSFEDQLMDSVNIEGHKWLTEIYNPVGLRYHGLHHMFPTLPYHSLPEAHRRLMQILPQDSFYRATVEKSLLSALRTLWKNSSTAKERAALASEGALS
jgi:fatty acid desaturase